jgi:hypothetical protein
MDGKKIKSGRRGFLIGAGTAGMAGAAVAATGGRAPVAEADKVAKPQTDGRGGGYHVTDHVRRYYRSTLV